VRGNVMGFMFGLLTTEVSMDTLAVEVNLSDEQTPIHTAGTRSRKRPTLSGISSAWENLKVARRGCLASEPRAP
jgi:hypothetical protein